MLINVLIPILILLALIGIGYVLRKFFKDKQVTIWLLVVVVAIPIWILII